MNQIRRSPLALAIIAATTASLSGCFGGDSASQIGSSASGSAQTSVVIGKVVDGYVQNATVCYDSNGNMLCDAGEPSATTDENGDFSLEGVPKSALSDYKNILAVLEKGVSIDMDTQEAVTHDSILSLSTYGLKSERELKIDAQQNNKELSDLVEAIVSPASHIVNQYIQAEINSTGSASNPLAIEAEVEKAKALIETTTGVDSDVALQDWVKLRESETDLAVKQQWWKAQQIAMSAVIGAQQEIELLKSIRDDYEPTASDVQKALESSVTEIKSKADSMADSYFEGFETDFLVESTQSYQNDLNQKHYQEAVLSDSFTSSLSGKVFNDGYISGAEVCIDANNNRACDLNEITATTDADGYFELSGINPSLLGTFATIIANIPANSNESLTTDHQLSAFLDKALSNEEITFDLPEDASIKDNLSLFISPATHLIASQVNLSDSEMTDELNNLKLTALNELALFSGVGTDELEGDLLRGVQDATDNDEKLDKWKQVEILSALVTGAYKEKEIVLSIDPDAVIDPEQHIEMLRRAMEFVNNYILDNPISDSLTSDYLLNLVEAYESEIRLNVYPDSYETDGIFSLAGKVYVDGYIKDAKVCIDINKNMACDIDEPNTSTDENGYFQLDGIPLDNKKNIRSVLLAEMESGVAVDMSSNSAFSESRTLSYSLENARSLKELELSSNLSGIPLSELIEINISPISHVIASTIQGYLSSDSGANDFALTAKRDEIIELVSTILSIDVNLEDLVRFESDAVDASSAQQYWYQRQIARLIVDTALNNLSLKGDSASTYGGLSSEINNSIYVLLEALDSTGLGGTINYVSDLYENVYKEAERLFQSSIAESSTISDSISELNSQEVSNAMSLGIYSLTENGVKKILVNGSDISAKQGFISGRSFKGGVDSDATIVLGENGSLTPLITNNFVLNDTLTLTFGEASVQYELIQVNDAVKSYVIQNNIVDSNVGVNGNIYVLNSTVNGQLLAINGFESSMTAQDVVDNASEAVTVNGHTVYTIGESQYITYENVVFGVSPVESVQIDPAQPLSSLTMDNLAFDESAFDSFQESFSLAFADIPTSEQINESADIDEGFDSESHAHKLIVDAGSSISLTCSSSELFNSQTNSCYTPTVTPSISGKVLDTYISNATVCIDVNKNWACDLSEPSTTTDSEGSFELTGFAAADLDERDEYLLAEIKKDISQDFAQSQPYSFDALLSLNYNSLQTDLEGTITSSRNVDKGVYVSPLTHELNISIRNTIENGATTNSPVLDQQIATREIEIANTYGNGNLSSDEIYSDLYKAYADGGNTFTDYKTQQFSSTLIYMQNTYQKVVFSGQENFALTTENLVNQHKSFEDSFSVAVGSITSEDEAKADFNFPGYINSYYFDILSTGAEADNSEASILEDSENTVEAEIRTEGLFKFKEFELIGSDLSYAVDKVSSVNTVNFEVNSLTHDNSISPSINQVDINNLATNYVHFTASLNATNGMFQLDIPTGINITSGASTYTKLDDSYESNNYAVSTYYATRVIKSAFGIDDTVKDNIFSDENSKIFFIPEGAVESYKIVDDTTLDYAADVLTDFDALFNISGTEVAKSGDDYYTEIGGVTYELSKQTQTQPEELSEGRELLISELSLNSTALDELKRYVESNTIYSIPDSSNFDAGYNYDVSDFNLTEYINQILAN